MDNIKDQRTIATTEVTKWQKFRTAGTTTFSGPSQVVVYPLQIRWKPEDHLFTSTTPPNTAPSNTSTSSASSSHSAEGGVPPKSFPTGAKVGLAVGLTFGLIIIGIILWLWKRTRMRVLDRMSLPQARHYNPNVELHANATQELWAPSNPVRLSFLTTSVFRSTGNIKTALIPAPGYKVTNRA